MTEPTGHSPLRAELGATLRLAAPLAAANLLQMLVHAVDMIFVARLGEEALAASSVSLAVFGLTLWCLSGLTGASGALIASELGRRAHAVREVRRSVRMALWLAVATGLGGCCWPPGRNRRWRRARAASCGC
jgi:MATE family multidrug resistance protein